MNQHVAEQTVVVAKYLKVWVRGRKAPLYFLGEYGLPEAHVRLASYLPLQRLESVAAVRLGLSSAYALRSACEFLFSGLLMESTKVGFPDLYHEDILKLDRPRPSLASVAVARTIAAAAVQLAGLSSRLFPE